MQYAWLMLAVLGAVLFFGLRHSKTLVSAAILGFARSMDKTSWYAVSRRAQRERY